MINGVIEAHQKAAVGQRRLEDVVKCRTDTWRIQTRYTEDRTFELRLEELITLLVT